MHRQNGFGGRLGVHSHNSPLILYRNVESELVVFAGTVG